MRERYAQLSTWIPFNRTYKGNIVLKTVFNRLLYVPNGGSSSRKEPQQFKGAVWYIASANIDKRKIAPKHCSGKQRTNTDLAELNTRPPICKEILLVHAIKHASKDGFYPEAVNVKGKYAVFYKCVKISIQTILRRNLTILPQNFDLR